MEEKRLRVLLAGLKPELSRVLSDFFTEKTDAVECASNYDYAYDLVCKCPFDVIIVDILRSNPNALLFIDKVRQGNMLVPVLALSADDSIESKIDAYKRGVDDFIVKPFYVEEVFARSHALTQRKNQSQITNLSFSNLTLLRDTKQLTDGTNYLDLTNREYEILTILMVNANKIILKETLTQSLWGVRHKDGNSLEVYLSNLRKRMRKLNTAVAIKSVRKAGYSIVDTENENRLGNYGAILIVEKDPKIAKAIEKKLSVNNTCESVATQEEALHRLSQSTFDVVVADIRDGEEMGLDFVKAVKAQNENLAVLVLGNKASLSETLLAFSSSADDYLCKPLSLTELSLRVLSLATKKVLLPVSEYTYEDLILNDINKTVKKDDKVASLSSKEYEIFEFILQANGEVVTKEQIKEHVWGDEETFNNSCEVYLSFLRKKLAPLNSKVRIKCVRKIGYKIIIVE